MASKLLRRRRVFRLITFLAVAGVIFVLFQIFSVEMLHNSDKGHPMRLVASPLLQEKDKQRLNLRKPSCLDDPHNCDNSVHNASNAVIQGKNKLYLNRDRDGLELQNNQNLNRPAVKHKQDHFILENDVVKKDSDSLENGYRVYDANDYGVEDGDVALEDVVVDEEKLPRGVPRTQAQLYLPDQDDMFTCLSTKEKIAFSFVNDDYCDCEDSSDEPGTNACPDSRFYCRFQLAGDSALKWVFSSRVNDGICDCCDGSDEWLNVRLADMLLLNDGMVHYGVRQGPCDNRCSQLQAEVKRQSAMQVQGAKLRRQYINSLTANIKANKLYGTEGAYYMLAEECFKRSADKYQYTVCPYKEVLQSDGATAKVIGRGGQWMHAHRLRMGNGDSSQCPGMRKRLAIIAFECGLRNEVLSIQETEVCEYTFRFSTPAAC